MDTLDFLGLRYREQLLKTTQNYKDVAFVDVPGQVSCTTSERINSFWNRNFLPGLGVSLPSTYSNPSGKTVVIESIPPSKQQVEATVVVNIQDSIPDTTALAFDISGLTCSVLKITDRISGGVGRAVTLVDSSRQHIYRGWYVHNSFGANSSITEFTGHFIVNTSSSAYDVRIGFYATVYKWG